MFESKLPSVGTTIFSVMTALAQKAGAVNVSQGFPDYPIDPLLTDLLEQASRDGWNQYAPMPGVSALRLRVSEKYEGIHGCRVDPELEVTITPGGTAAIFSALAAVIRPADEVIVFEPCYDSYGPSVEMIGGVVVPLPLQTPSYTPDWDQVREAITPKTRVIIINTPHNPCGSTLTSSDINELAEICERHNILVISDEVYELITFDGVQHVSPLMHSSLRDRCFVISSFGKTFHITGWKVGVCVASELLTREFRKAHQFISFSVNAPAQHALATYMSEPSNYARLSEFFVNKRNLFRELMSGSKWSIRPCTGSYFQLIGYESISAEHDVDFAQRLVRENGVACIPLSPFYRESSATPDMVLRVCFAKSDETLREAARRLRSV
ncbi:MAG: aminotransferase class I/II-fold pyridoxal phosphate-dependent enzyme [Candidatus Kapabacteria bacterium]|nr:aminotransferase class I/II-fold pyridoxal phosphate-dependent enzyme [Candidatus Kapabacteria bacterium]